MIITIYEYSHAIENGNYEKDSIPRSNILNFINKNGFRYIYNIDCLKAYNKVMHHINKSFELGKNQSVDITAFRDIN